ncbi:MAG TPA: hypothetical protein VFY23_09555 [Candidatus Limnocylindrales bacterium]|nr:hypothetical protein [Candidatus Limnocylindrales bacterium]
MIVTDTDAGGGGRAEVADDLRATSESIAADAERLVAVEERKQDLPPDDPEVRALSAEAERIARRILPKTVAERELATDAAKEGG